MGPLVLYRLILIYKLRKIEDFYQGIKKTSFLVKDNANYWSLRLNEKKIWAERKKNVSEGNDTIKKETGL